MALLQRAKHISIDVKDVSLSYALDKIFESQPLTYKIVQRVIIVQERGEKSVKGVSLIGGGGPNEEIRGKFTTEDRDPIAGANVSVKGTRKIVTIHRNGEYGLSDILQGAVISVVFVEYERRGGLIK